MLAAFITRWKHLWFVGMFALITLLEVTQIRVIELSNGTKLPLGMLFRIPLAYYGYWTVVSPVIIWLARRFPLTPKRWPISLSIHIASWCLLSALHAFYRAPIHNLIYPWMHKGGGFWGVVWYYFAGNLTSNLLIYSVIALVTYSWSYLDQL